MPGLGRAIGAGAVLGAVLLLLSACGTTNYNSDLGALAGAVEHASKGHFVRVKCAGVIPYEHQKKLKQRLHSKAEYRYFCTGETAAPAGSPKAPTKVIRVSLDGRRWHDDKAEDAEQARDESVR